MRRLFWVSLGATVGILVVRKAQKTVESLKPSGIADNVRTGVSEFTGGFRQFGDEVKVAMLERETELREALGLDDDGVAN